MVRCFIVHAILSAAVGLAALLVAPAQARSPHFKVLYSFTGQSDGADPGSRLIRDRAGSLYGTTYQGGDMACGGNSGCGAVFRLAPDGKETVLHAFVGASDGASPGRGVIADSKGNLYGATQGGTFSGTNSASCPPSGCGTIYKIAADATKTIIYRFKGGSDGSVPNGELLMDQSGNLYGGTQTGGGTGCHGFGCGAIYKLAPDGTETVLYRFQGGNDGGDPLGGLIEDQSGNLYGTTILGGWRSSGVLFRVSQGGSETVLYRFCSQTNCVDGSVPEATLIGDGSGNLYGTTYEGGTGTLCFQGCGTVYELAPDGAETVLYSFIGRRDGASPFAALLDDGKANLYGTAYQGGATNNGVAFSLTPRGKETVLHAFNQTDGAFVASALIADDKGNLYGTASQGGTHGYGEVFEIRK
jgi:uncharacterized repeat protein (TIGR03803 family)